MKCHPPSPPHLFASLARQAPMGDAAWSANCFGFLYLEVLHVYFHVHCVHEFCTNHSRSQFILGNVDKFWNPKFASSIFRGDKRYQAKKNRCIKVRKTGLVRTLKYPGPPKTGVVCGPYIGVEWTVCALVLCDLLFLSSNPCTRVTSLLDMDACT